MKKLLFCIFLLAANITFAQKVTVKGIYLRFSYQIGAEISIGKRYAILCNYRFTDFYFINPYPYSRALLPEIRYYFDKDKKNRGFLSLYGKISEKWEYYERAGSNLGSVYAKQDGIGVLGGYKHYFGKHFNIELFCGGAVLKSKGTSSLGPFNESVVAPRLGVLFGLTI